ncbi:MAG: hypothetical protein IKP64_11415 [Selenomonadaceae bacterium]|nr:hypothetical protein [Selenomonadaceae bacterium]
MKRPIKFRGRDIDTGEIIYGDFREIGIHAHIFKEADCYYEEELIEVDPDSVAQLVGYDKDGREVYEGDKLVSVDNGAVWVAVLNPTVTLPKYEHLESSNLELIGLKLQENQS